MDLKSGKSESSRVSQKRKLKDRSPSTTTRIFFTPKVCSCCVQPLGLFLSRGSNCPKCGQKVCKKCKVYNQHTSLWNCLLCAKKMQVYGNPGGSTTTPQIASRPDQTPFSTIKRSWSISAATNRSSPVLKSYTKYSDDRQFNSLPRMPSNYHEVPHQNGRKVNLQENLANTGQYNTGGGTGKRKKPNLLTQAFSSTLHPFLPSQYRKSPSSSINFIEDEYWDYWDEYEFRSNRSSCERSLGESVEYQHSFNNGQPPKKPERRKSRSMGAFDTKYSTLKQYCLVSAQQPPHFQSSSLPRKKKRSEKENTVSIDVRNPPNQPQPSLTRVLNTYSDNVYVEGTNVHFSTLPRRDHFLEPLNNRRDREIPTTFSTLPKTWKVGGSTSTTLISPDPPPPQNGRVTRTTTLLNAQDAPLITQNVVRTIAPSPPPVTSKKRELPRKVRTDYMTKETYPLFAKRPLILLTPDIEQAYFPDAKAITSNVNTDKSNLNSTVKAGTIKNSSSTDKAATPREVIIEIELESKSTGSTNSSNSSDMHIKAHSPIQGSASKLEAEISGHSVLSPKISGKGKVSAQISAVSEASPPLSGSKAINLPEISGISKASPKGSAVLEHSAPFSGSTAKILPEISGDSKIPAQIISSDSEITDSHPGIMEIPDRYNDRFKDALYSSSDSSCQSFPDMEERLGALQGDLWTLGADSREFLSCIESEGEAEGVGGYWESDVREPSVKTTIEDVLGTPEQREPPEPSTRMGLSAQAVPNCSTGIIAPTSNNTSDDENDERRSTTTTTNSTVVEAEPSIIDTARTTMSNHSANIDSGTPSRSNRKYKSRVLVNGDDADPQEPQIEISGEGVEIVTGVATTPSHYNGPSPNQVKVPALRRNSPVYFIPIRRETTDNGNVNSNLTDNGESPAETESAHIHDPVTIIEISSSSSSSAVSQGQDEPDSKHNIMETETEAEGSSGRRESPEGEEAEKQMSMSPSEPAAETDSAAALKRSSPDGAYECTESDSSPTPVLEMNSGSEGEDSTDSWTEEVSFEDTEHPAPLDRMLHTIVEESCEESEPETQITKSNLNELEKYYNFTVDLEPGAEGIMEQTYAESEFSDTFSESNCSFNSELVRNSLDLDATGDPVELASGRLEKYFMNLGGLSNDSDSVGSESETDTRIVENRKKVLKHHRRSAEFEDELQLVSEDDDSAFHQEGIDTIKKQRKLRRSNEDLLDAQDTPSQAKPPVVPSVTDEIRKEPVAVSRSNSFTWSSDEEVNLMMHKLRQLIKNLAKSKKPDEEKNEKLIYLENELIRLMKNEQNIKNIVVDSISSDEDFEAGQATPPSVPAPAPSSSPNPILSKLSSHIGQRLSTWMQEELIVGEPGVMKCAPSVSSDLNEDRFSWKGSFESTLAKRQSVGSSDSIDGGVGSFPEGPEVFTDRSILRSSSLHHLANSQPILEESESLTSSLSRLHSPPPSSSSSSNRNSSNINRAKSLFLSQQQIKSARYRPPSYFENSGKETNTNHASTPVLSTLQFKEDEARHFDSNTMNQEIKIRGQVEFLMQYNYRQSTFELCVKQCRDLAAVDVKRGRSDPYVKAYLLPDRTKSSKKKTKTKRNTLNPVFGETLKFPISLEELQNRTLLVSAWHSDIFGKNEFLGQVTLGLRDVTFDDTNYVWYTLEEQQTSNESTGETPVPSEIAETPVPELDLVVALKWINRSFQKGNLTILVKEAKGLPLVKNSPPSTFVKCTPVTDKSKKQKTALCRRTLTPAWNSTMSFENISSDGLEITLYHSELLNHEQIGHFTLDYDSELWREMGSREGFWVEGIIRLTQ